MAEKPAASNPNRTSRGIARTGGPRLAGVVLLALAFALPFAPVVAAQDGSADGSRTQDGKRLDGFWPSKNMIRLIIGRMIDEERERYELTDEQADRWREVTTERWVKFAEENRRELQPLANEFIEMRLEMEPPSPERIKAWATGAEKAFESIRSEMMANIDEFREILNPLQEAKLETNLLEFNAGLELAKAKLEQWRRGEYAEREFWDPPASQRRAERARAEAERLAEQQRKQAEEEKQKDQILAELDAWEQYVKSFIELYQLDEGQQMTARTSLNEIKERAVKHRERYKDQIDRLEEMIETNKGDENRLAVVEEKLVELYGPIDEMFAELKQRLEKIPTDQQKTRVAELQAKVPGGDESPSNEPEEPPQPPSTKDG